MSRKPRWSRRNVLQGLGAAVALPFLESMPAPRLLAAPPEQPEGVSGAPPRRMAFLFVPNGANMRYWTPGETGFGFTLPRTLEPLAPYRDDVSVLTGLTHDKGRSNGDGPGDHARSASVFLTGSQPRKTSGANIRVGTSVDQVAAEQIGHLTRFPSLELGIDRGRNAGECDSGYSCAYSSNISWSSPTTPRGKEVNPRAVFDRLFAGEDQAASTQRRGMQDHLRNSILDFVADDARRLQDRLGQADRRKLDEYLTGIREIERRLERADDDPMDADDMGVAPPPGVPRDYQRHVRLMCDMMVLAFQTDLTRVATMMFADAASNRNYLPIEVPDGHHDLSHHGGNGEKLEKIARINRYHVEQFAYLLDRLRSIPEGDGNLLDHCMIVYGSGISDGNRHNNENLPVLLAGRGGGTLIQGRHIRYRYETPMTNLYLALLDRMGTPVARLGDSTGRLTQLS